MRHWTHGALIGNDGFANGRSKGTNAKGCRSFGCNDLSCLVFGFCSNRLTIDGDLLWQTLVQGNTTDCDARPSNLGLFVSI